MLGTLLTSYKRKALAPTRADTYEKAIGGGRQAQERTRWQGGMIRTGTSTSQFDERGLSLPV